MPLFQFLAGVVASFLQKTGSNDLINAITQNEPEQLPQALLSTLDKDYSSIPNI